MLFAAVAVVFAYRAYVKESRIEKRLRDSEERAQASKVAAWIGPDPEPDPRARVGGDFVVIRNSSESPIYTVIWWVQFGVNTVRSDDLTIMVLPPSTTGTKYRVPRQILEALEGVEDWEPSNFAVGLRFVDASGVRWRRNSEGHLEKAPEDAQIDFFLSN